MEPEPSDQQRRFEIAPELAGERLDRALHTLMAEYSRTWLKRLIQAGSVRVDGRPARPSHPVAAGEQVDVDLRGGEDDPLGLLARMEVPVLLEDPWILVLDKPAGIAVHPNTVHGKGTLAQWAEARCGPLPTEPGAEERPGVVHRLDKETSGVLVMARTEAALRHLKDQFRRREVQKEYLALVHGVPEFTSDFVEARIARDPLHSQKMRVVAEGGRESTTYYEVLERLAPFALLLCRPGTGRTHQIRVHMAHIGHSLLADRLYSSPSAQRHRLPPEAPPLDRHALHARLLTFTHPGTGERVSCEARLPADLAGLLAWLRSRAPR